MEGAQVPMASDPPVVNPWANLPAGLYDFLVKERPMLYAHIGGLEKSLAFAWAQINLIKRENRASYEKLEALRRCLTKSGRMSPMEFEIERHRACFQWYQAQDPTKVTEVHGLVPSALPRSTFNDQYMLSHCQLVLLYSDGNMVAKCAALSSQYNHIVQHHSRIYAIGGLSLRRTQPATMMDTVESLDIMCGVWDPLTPLTKARHRAGTAVCKGKLYVFGGLVQDTAQSSVECLDMLTGAWEPDFPAMLNPRAACAAAASTGVLYVLGGSNDGKTILNSVDVFQLRMGHWEPGPPMLAARISFSAVAFRGAVHAIGGQDAARVLSSCESLQLRERAIPLPPLGRPRSELAAVAYNGKLFAIGGIVSNKIVDTVECLRPEVGVWEIVRPLRHPVASCSAAVSKGCIYVLGGSDGSRSLSSVQVLRAGELSWSSGPPLKFPRMAIAAGTSLSECWCDKPGRSRGDNVWVC